MQGRLADPSSSFYSGTWLVYFVASIIKYFQDTKDLLYLKRYYFCKIQEFYRLVCRLAQNLPEKYFGTFYYAEREVFAVSDHE
jgi:hypothetical protein